MADKGHRDPLVSLMESIDVVHVHTAMYAKCKLFVLNINVFLLELYVAFHLYIRLIIAVRW